MKIWSLCGFSYKKPIFISFQPPIFIQKIIWGLRWKVDKNYVDRENVKFFCYSEARRDVEEKEDKLCFKKIKSY